MATLFTALFESNNWSEWDSTTGSLTMATAAGAALGGSSYGVEISIAASQIANAFNDLGNFAGYSEYTIELRIDPQNLVISGTPPNLLEVLSIYDSNPLRRFKLELQDNGNEAGEIFVVAGVHDDSSTQQNIGSYALTPITTDTRVTIRVKKASSGVASDGELEIYFNGTSKASRVDIDIFDKWSVDDPMELRLIGGIGTSSSKYYVDAIRVDSGFPGFGTYDLTRSAGGIPGSII